MTNTNIVASSMMKITKLGAQFVAIRVKFEDGELVFVTPNGL